MTRNRFEAGAERYARFRPSYPPELAAHLAEAARRSAAASGSADDAELCALDVGCGTGQLTRGLAEHFTRVIGADPSADQLSRATAHPRITYVRAPAEALPAADASVHLVAAAQAAHWFDLDAFYSEVRRVAAPHAVLALVSYGVIETPPEFAPMFDRFYTEGIGPFWPPERRHVDAGYATLAFPFPELPMSDLAIVRDLALDDFLGYVSTWTAVHAAAEAGRDDVFAAFAADLRALWGDPARRYTFRWPLRGRLGRV